jgi:hypothetical protein
MESTDSISSKAKGSENRKLGEPVFKTKNNNMHINRNEIIIGRSKNLAIVIFSNHHPEMDGG